MDEASWTAASTWLPRSLLIAVVVNVAVASLGWLAKTVTTPGAAVGAVIGISVFAFAGPAGWLMLFASFAAAAVSSSSD